MIETTGRPISQRAYRTPLLKQQMIASVIDDMLHDGAIQPSSSPWASPVCLVPKNDGSICFAIVYRRLNAVTKRDQYPLLNIHMVGGAKFFTTLDLKAGY